MFCAGFPDPNVTVEDVIAEGEMVSSRGTMWGTHRGEFQGISSPTGNPVEISYVDIWRVEDGKLVENWVQIDMLGMTQRLGVIPHRSRAKHDPYTQRDPDKCPP